MTPRLTPLASPLLSDLPGVRHAFFTRQGGVSEGLYEGLNLGQGSNDAPDKVDENRRRAEVWFGETPSRLLVCHQIHSPIVVCTTEPFETRPKADGVATTQSGLICVALHADCAPILLADPQARVVAAVHAGWRGALSGVAEAGVAAMVSLGASPYRLRAAVGPCIGPASYEVGLDFLDAFLRQDPECEAYFQPGASPQKRYFNLPAYVLERLRRAGVAQAEWIGADTLSDETRFYSNRRSVLRGKTDYGRLGSAIALF